MSVEGRDWTLHVSRLISGIITGTHDWEGLGEHYIYMHDRKLGVGRISSAVKAAPIRNPIQKVFRRPVCKHECLGLQSTEGKAQEAPVSVSVVLEGTTSTVCPVPSPPLLPSIPAIR